MNYQKVFFRFTIVVSLLLFSLSFIFNVLPSFKDFKKELKEKDYDAIYEIEPKTKPKEAMTSEEFLDRLEDQTYIGEELELGPTKREIFINKIFLTLVFSAAPLLFYIFIKYVKLII